MSTSTQAVHWLKWCYTRPRTYVVLVIGLMTCVSLLNFGILGFAVGVLLTAIYSYWIIWKPYENTHLSKV